MYLSIDVLSRFESKFEKCGDDECWEWLGSKNQRGYGFFNMRIGGVSTNTYSAHRLSWAIANNQDIPPKKMICHHCDNPSCVNPRHLYIGTGFDNNTDTVKRGRAKRKVGEDCSWAKLTKQDILTIRESTERQYVLAARYGVSQPHISRIKSMDRNMWTCVI